MIVDADRTIAAQMIHAVDCFFCGDPCDLPLITWAGATGPIVLHPACTGKLVLRLARDVLEVEHLASLLETAA
jgi:hypothetical protein